MATVEVDGTTIAYEIIGEGPPWVITPGGRFSKETPGVRELAEALAARGRRVLIWDRPNTGASDVCFAGASESQMQADHLAGLLQVLDLAPATIVGGSGGARVSLLAAATHPAIAERLAVWWISGGPFGLLTLAIVYCGDSIRAAWQGGMQAVVELPEWAEVLERNPGNRRRFLDLDPRQFIDTLERWMLVYCPDPAMRLPGLADDALARLSIPALVFRSGASDPYHTRATSESLAGLIPGARLVEPPWGDREWIERSDAARNGTGHLFERWPLLAPQLLEFAAEKAAY
ncbi:MAG TPA: alpha/beta hydrolase [Acidimicrobiia bacterium]|nr:alpha/beta hydrolase [Acidimicrobiia bacterium]